MSGFPNSPRLVKGGIVLVDPDSGAVQKIIVLQYNPDTLTRTLAPQGVKEEGDRSEALRLTGPHRRHKLEFIRCSLRSKSSFIRRAPKCRRTTGERNRARWRSLP